MEQAARRHASPHDDEETLRSGRMIIRTENIVKTFELGSSVVRALIQQMAP